MHKTVLFETGRIPDGRFIITKIVMFGGRQDLQKLVKIGQIMLVTICASPRLERGVSVTEYDDCVFIMDMPYHAFWQLGECNNCLNKFFDLYGANSYSLAPKYYAPEISEVSQPIAV